VAKKRAGRYPKEFRRMAVERLKSCDNIVALAKSCVYIVACCTNGEINWSRWRSPRSPDVLLAIKSSQIRDLESRGQGCILTLAY